MRKSLILSGKIKIYAFYTKLCTYFLLNKFAKFIDKIFQRCYHLIVKVASAAVVALAVL